MRFKRIFLITMDSLGVGEAEDANEYNSVGTNTLGHVNEKCNLFVPNLKKLGFLNTINMDENPEVDAYYTIAKPKNYGVDTLNSYYELAGINNKARFNTYNETGFPTDFIEMIEKYAKKRIIGNKMATTENIINELGERHLNYGSLIIYTSFDSTLKVAAHEDVISVHILYKICELIRKISDSKTDWRVGRVIARPFTGKPGKFKKSSDKKTYTVKPPKLSVLNTLKDNNLDVISIGRINDIYNGEGITKKIKSATNMDTLNKLTDIMDKKFTGLCFANLNDFDLLGHLKDVEGYAKAIEEFDVEIPMLLNKLNMDDLLIITGTHGNDPTTVGNIHTRENIPVIMFSRDFKEPKRLDPMNTYADIAATIADNFEIKIPDIGTSILENLH